MTLPTLFLSHGSPILAFEERHAVHRFLREAAALWPRPRALLVVSAHWEEAVPALTGAARPETIHDYGPGFPYREMYTCRYPAPGAVEAAARARDLLAEAGIDAEMDPQRGFDHGCWAPLRLLYPAADLPVAQLSLAAGASPAHHFRIGRALAPLRDDGVLLIGSGTMTHNQRDLDRSGARPTPDWARAFAAWMQEKLLARDDEAALDYRRRAPHAAHSHPTEEHLMPLFVPLGAATPGLPPRQLHHSFTFSTQAMDAYLFA
ncbi:MAG: dioxygenase [Rhodospirillaceae bacterium]|nr:dioxygenase [Rhodospirillaceae bacterium]